MALSLEKRGGNVYAVGSFAAKTYFAELIRMVENGSVITITRNGHDIASVQSPQTKENKKALAAWKGLREICSLSKPGVKSDVMSGEKSESSLIKESENLEGDTSSLIQEIEELKNAGRK